MMVHRYFSTSVLKKCVLHVFKACCCNKDPINHSDLSAPVGIECESDSDA
jgi:uncharacterized protein (DUF927 family)